MALKANHNRKEAKNNNYRFIDTKFFLFQELELEKGFQKDFFLSEPHPPKGEKQVMRDWKKLF